MIGLLHALVVWPLGLHPALRLLVMALLADGVVQDLVHCLRAIPHVGRLITG